MNSRPVCLQGMNPQKDKDWTHKDKDKDFKLVLKDKNLDKD